MIDSFDLQAPSKHIVKYGSHLFPKNLIDFGSDVPTKLNVSYLTI